MNRQPTEWEKIFAHQFEKELLYQELILLKSKKSHHPFKKSSCPREILPLSLLFDLQQVRKICNSAMCLCLKHFDAGESLMSVHLKGGRLGTHKGGGAVTPESWLQSLSRSPREPDGVGLGRDSHSFLATELSPAPSNSSRDRGARIRVFAALEVPTTPSSAPIPTVAGPGHPTARSP